MKSGYSTAINCGCNLNDFLIWKDTVYTVLDDPFGEQDN